MCDVNDMSKLVDLIAMRIAEVYHMPLKSAEAALRKSKFYGVLKESRYIEDAPEVNFRRYQNEIEYGAWNRNEFGEIVE